MTKILQTKAKELALNLPSADKSYGKIKNLVFDFGGVFVKIELQGCVEAFRSLGFNDVGEYLNPYQQKGLFGDLEAGRMTDEEFRRCIGEHCGREVGWDDCQKGWLGFMAGVEQANLGQLLKFKKEGYRLALLSNTNPFITSWFRSDKFDGNGHGIGHYIPQEHQYLSFEQKCMKPGKEIFGKMLEGEGFVPDETMFVDDGEANLNTAKELGMHTFQPINGEDWGSRLEKELKRLADTASLHEAGVEA